MIKKWTETKISRLIKEGRGQGSGASYLPWLQVRDISSAGRKHLVPNTRFGRDVHLLSDIEYRLFLMLEWSDDVSDVNEQCPLDRDLTQLSAKKLGIRHPYYPGTSVPTVMTVDFMVTLVRNGQQTFEAFNAKDDSKASNEREMEKLEIQIWTLREMDIKHHLMFGGLLSKQKAKNLDWLINASIKENEVQPWPDYYEEMTQRFGLHISTAARVQPNTSLSQTCADFDAMHGAHVGTGLRAARLLMRRKEILFDLAVEEPAAQPVASFTYRIKGTQFASDLRATGGRK